jgi:hypothetical protein
MYDYRGTAIRAVRLARGTDHCGSPGRVFGLAELVASGLIMDPEAPTRLLTKRKLIYAVNEAFEINVAEDGVRGTSGAVKHETLFRNAPVRAAGELFVEQGIIVRVNDRSGSYGTEGRMDSDRRFSRAVLAGLAKAAATVTEAELVRLREKAHVNGK